jgi:hypothetical protein
MLLIAGVLGIDAIKGGGYRVLALAHLLGG